MKASEVKKLKIGDRIEVNAIHFRDGRKKATRKIKNITSMGVEVALFGWSNFALKNSEIINKVQ